MARISVKEKDLSWYYRQRQRGNLVVYMPGLSTFGPDTPTYVYEDNFNTLFGSAINVKNDYSFYMAESLIRSGIDVLFHRMIPAGAAQAQGTLNGSEYAVTITNAANKYRVSVNNKTGTDLVIVIDGISYTFTANDTTDADFDLSKKETVDLAFARYEEDPDYDITKSVVDNSVTITVGTGASATSRTFPAGVTSTRYFSVDDVTAVNAAIAEIEAADTKHYHTIAEPEYTTGGDIVKAKYFGSLGNHLTVEAKRGSSHGLRYVYVYKDGILVEQFTVDFADPMSKYYYEAIEDQIKYIAFDITDERLLNDADEVVLGTCALSNGKDYDGVDPIQDVVTNKLAILETFDVVKDPYGYYFDVVINGGLYDREIGYVADQSNGNYKADINLKNVAAETGTSVYLMSAGYETTEDEFFAYCGDSEFISTPFASAIGPWCYSQLVSNGVYAWMPGFYAFLIAWGNSISSGNPAWYAPAGAQRAKVGSIVKRPKYEIGKAILDKWQNQDSVTLDVYKLNPIMNLKQYGYCVYGNSTLLANKPDGSTSMLQSLGTRVLVNQIKEKAFEVALGLQFDQLTDNLFMAFKIAMGRYMDAVKYQGGLFDYDIVIDRSTVTYDDLNQKTVPVKIRISPNPAAENFNILCEVYPAGITFTDEFQETGVLV